MKGQVLHAVWYNIPCEAVGEIWNWSLLGMKGCFITYFNTDLERHTPKQQPWHTIPRPFINSIIYQLEYQQIVIAAHFTQKFWQASQDHQKLYLRATFCNHRESLQFFRITHNFSKDTLWWVIPKNHIKNFERYLLFRKFSKNRSMMVDG